METTNWLTAVTTVTLTLSITQFFVLGFVLFKIYLFKRKMEDTFDTLMVSEDKPDLRQHLIENYINTEDEVSQMTDEQVRKVYLSFNKKVIDQTANSFLDLMATTYVTVVDKVIPMATNKKLKVVEHDKLARDLKKDVFVKAAIDRFFPSLYYKYGTFLAPFSVGIQTIGHLEKNITIENEEPKEIGFEDE
jgi:hypothetical protein